MWVPINEKLKETLETYKQWDAKTSFVGWKVCNDGISLCKVLGKTTTVSDLDLSFNGLGDKEVKELANAIKENALHNQGPKDDGKLQELGTFKKINLSNNHIHFKRDSEMQGGICSLTQVLMDTSIRRPGFSEFSLRELNLANNYLGPEGAAEIAKVLKTNRHLMRVDLSWCLHPPPAPCPRSSHHPGPPAWRRHAPANLLRRNNIGNEGLVEVLESLRSFHRAARINLRHNLFSPQPPVRLDAGWAGLKRRLRRTLGPDNLDGDSDARSGVVLGWSETPLAAAKT